MSFSDDQNLECPLCMEPFEMDDFNFFPCTCGYQICRFCWHRIRTDENGLCPACRKQYPEDPADFKPLSVEELQKIKSEKRQKDQQRKQKMSECRKHLANVRVVQKNLVFVVGLPARLADSEVLRKHDYFGKFGKIHKVVVNQSTSYAGSQGPSASAYVTYCKPEDALRAIKSVNNIQVDGRTLKASLGTTKYCSHFLKNQQCPKTDCMYLHELGDEAASFTKEDMQQGKHQEYEKKLQDQILGCNNRKHSVSPTPQQKPNSSKESWPVQSSKEPKQKLKEPTQGQKSDKSNRSKAKHNNGDNQKSKRGKTRISDASHSAANLHKMNKEDTPASKKNQKQSRHTKDSLLNQTHDGGSEERSNVHVINPTSDISEMNIKNTQTTFVEITEKRTSNHSSANIKINRSESPSLPSSPASSSSSCLFTPFGSLSSNFLSSSPSPPPSNPSQGFKVLGNNIQDSGSTNIYAMSTSMEQKRASPCNVFGSIENNDSLFSHMTNLVLSNDVRSYNGQLLAEDENSPNGDSDWNSTFPYGSSSKQLEDDLDFDPWDESSKGLADLMAKEADTNSSYSNISMPPGFSFKHLVPNCQRIPIPPPGFAQNVQVFDAMGQIPCSYDANTAFCSTFYMNEKQQNMMDVAPHLFQHPAHTIYTSQCKQFPDPTATDINPQMTDFLQVNRPVSFQENFRALFPNINVSFGSPNLQKSLNQNGLTWNPSPRELSWFNDANILTSLNISEGQRSSAPYLMKALHQLKMEENLGPFNGHPSYTPPFPLRGQWPPLPTQCPPPGFVAPSRSPANTPFQHIPANQNIQ